MKKFFTISLAMVLFPFFVVAYVINAVVGDREEMPSPLEYWTELFECMSDMD